MQQAIPSRPEKRLYLHGSSERGLEKRKGRMVMWQEWINVIFGLWLAATPWLVIPTPNRTEGMIINCVITGLLIAGFSLWSGYSKGIWQNWIVIILCIWLFVAPGTLRYRVPAITWNNVIIGVLAGIFAILSIKRHKSVARKM
jgi:hypothetical protein